MQQGIFRYIQIKQNLIVLKYQESKLVENICINPIKVQQIFIINIMSINLTIIVYM